METTIWNSKGESVGSVELPEKVFGARASAEFLHEAADRVFKLGSHGGESKPRS